ncbi:Pnap_2097 family protein [Rhizobium rhizogenes]|uniref:Pnap_2097 family protein n=1 Tax=Rhizobium rhizogenes TaxID=359 RepID=UPI001F1D25E6|nr:Pnap_2097 family protein [Rhizobium rhizogenes]
MISLAVSAMNQPGISETHTLGMAEMGYKGLSEQWLMRRAGDLHWRLIAAAMGQQSAVFTCPAGEPLYAAFCATSLQLSKPELPRLGAELALHGSLHRVGTSRLGCLVRITVNRQYVGRLVLVSTFVGRSDLSSNRSIVRRAPRVLAMPAETSEIVSRVSGEAARIARMASQRLLDVPCDHAVKLLPCPAVDFNAAGLMYFPSFSALCDRATFEVFRGADMVAARHVVHLGNVEPGEAVHIGLRRSARGVEAAIHGDDARLLTVMRIRLTSTPPTRTT